MRTYRRLWIMLALGTLLFCTMGRRIIPACPRLVRLLIEAHETAECGEVLVVSRRFVSWNNLQVRFESIIRRAGLTPWPKPFQTMRKNCETDWAHLCVNGYDSSSSSSLASV